MPIKVEMIRENKVVLQTYSEPLKSTDMTILRNQMENVILPSASGKVHVIADLRDIQNLPGTILSSGSGMLRTPHPNTGQIIFITSNGFVSAMANIFAKLAPKQSVIAARSLEEAYKEVDALLAQGN